MSLLDRIKSMFGGSSDSGDAHAGHDHPQEPVAPPMPPADPAGMPTSAAAPAEEDDDTPA